MKVKYIVTILLILTFLQGFYIAATKSRTTDEINFHLHSGYKYLTEGKWEIGIDNPPLTSILVAIPLLFEKDISRFNNFNKIDELEYVKRERTPFPHSYLLIARSITMLFVVLMGFYVYLWAKELYGTTSGLLALLLFSFSPNILAFGSLATADIGGVSFAIVAMYYFWKFSHEPTKKNLILTGVFFGLTNISKMVGIFLLPAFLFYAMIIFFFRDFEAKFLLKFKNKKIKKFSDLFLSLAIVGLICLFMLHAVYMFKEPFVPLKHYSEDEFISSTFKDMRVNPALNWIPMPFPKKYVLGHDYAQYFVKDEVRGFFFLGRVDQQFKNFYLISFLIKTPIALFVLLILGYLVYRRITLTELYIWFFVISFFLYMSFFNKLIIGYRHILIIYPLLYIIASRVFHKGIPKNKIILGITTISIVWYIVSSLFVFPHHVAYFNEFIGGPKNGWKYTIDSNLDWGQDLNGVLKYIDKHPNEVLHVVPGCVAVTGKILVNANNLQFNQGRCYTWLKQNFEPIDYIGYSWLVYDAQGQWFEQDGRHYFRKY